MDNLQIETIDIYYLHNPETQLAEIDRTAFVARMRSAFEWFEKKVDEGKIRMYGTATWNGYRLAQQVKDYLSLEEIVLLAREAGGPGHHFKAVQLSFNLAMPEAWVHTNQRFAANTAPLLGVAERLGVLVIGSASLLQSRLAGNLPDFIRDFFPQFKKPSQCALQFSRSVAGITTSLVGMKTAEHVRENLGTAKVPPLNESEFFSLFQKAQ